MSKSKLTTTTTTTTTTTNTWWLPPKLLIAAISTTLLLIWVIDTSTLHFPPRPHPPHYLGTFSPLNTTITTTTITTTNAHTWLSIPFPPNYTSTLISRWLSSDDSRTTSIFIPGLDDDTVPNIKLLAGKVHEFLILALDDSGQPRSFGGDYFETDLSSHSWKSRPPVTDLGNGTYSFQLQIHPNFSGTFNFTVVLLFRSFEGLKFSPQRFKFHKQLRNIRIDFYREEEETASLSPSMELCKGSDFFRELWTGRWTRHGKRMNTSSPSCDVDDSGRYRCLALDFSCEMPWCDGPIGALESDGWVYSAHCSFRIFTQELAWNCLDRQWLFFWGDSNHVDTIRNLLNFVLGLPEIKSVPRRFDLRFANPKNLSQTVRITSIFNGHWNDSMNYLGLQSLKKKEFRELIWKYFLEDQVPDVLILNSGLHDGVYWSSIRAFVGGAEFAAGFWDEIVRHVRMKRNDTRVFYRTTIATGGYARDMAFNPNKMEAFNGVFLEKLKEKGLLNGGVIDDFDMTFPWHFDNRCNDGTHYGRAPAKARWRDGLVGHQYFVDLMLAHVLLNAVCVH
ncbi:SGNH hydrolase protein [Dioscorea alata]|uniref:SGNH hydrolase protein n=1 Tax=Dioscorea alata TaxID=55571 RepID=A0ACB7VRE2_DIOAL|nr:SGNH hydrolase protein [Dioscorea alata]